MEVMSPAGVGLSKVAWHRLAKTKRPAGRFEWLMEASTIDSNFNFRYQRQ